MVTAGEVIGLVCGFFLSYILVFVVNRQSFGWTFLFSVDWSQLVAAVPLIMLAALLAALPAARLVVRSSPAQALKEP
jgi:putative ABC transport system permease protein